MKTKTIKAHSIKTLSEKLNVKAAAETKSPTFTGSARGLTIV